jgi:hypothetical protein
MYGTKEMYGTDHSTIFSKQVNNVNTSGQAGTQIPHPPLGDDSSPFGR